MSYDDFVSFYPSAAKLSGVQCENCHGAGSQHAGDPLRISFSSSQSGVCGQCHQEKKEWANSLHNSTGVVNDQYQGGYQSIWLLATSCVRCHSAKGFSTYLKNGKKDLVIEAGAFPGVTCAACHDPHSAANPAQLRLAGNVTMVVDNSTVNAGKAATCYACHDGLYQYNEKMCDSNNDRSADTVCTTPDQAATMYYSTLYYQPVHYNTQAPVLEGKGALVDLNGDGTADFTLTENSFHTDPKFILASLTGNKNLPSENNKCITCHMAKGPLAGEKGHQQMGGHAIRLNSMQRIVGTLNGLEVDIAAEEIQLTTSCTICHPSVTKFNRTARGDYDGDDVLEGIQDEVRGLLLAVSTKIRSLDKTNINQSSGSMSSNGTISVGALSYVSQSAFTKTTNTLRRGLWNHNLIALDGSLGIHNAAFTVQVLQGTYTAVGGNSFATDYPKAILR